MVVAIQILINPIDLFGGGPRFLRSPEILGERIFDASSIESLLDQPKYVGQASQDLRQGAILSQAQKRSYGFDGK